MEMIKNITFERIDIYTKFGGRCAYCGEELNGVWCIDHVIPKVTFVYHIKRKESVPDFLKHLRIDDINHIDNLFPSCEGCNELKGAHSLERFRSELLRIADRMFNTNDAYRAAVRFGLIQQIKKKEIKFYFENHIKTKT